VMTTELPPAPIPPRHWPVSEQVPQEDRETVLTKTVEVGPVEIGAASLGRGASPAEPTGLAASPETEAGGEITQSREEAAPPAALSSCRMSAFHVRGRYCKVCGTVPE
jgi:hypothetical protein